MISRESCVRIVIVEKVEYISLLTKYDDDQTIFLALTPAAGLELKRKGIEYTNTLQFFTKADHSVVVKKSHKILKLLRSTYNISDDTCINESCKVTSFFYLRGAIVNYILAITSIVENIVNYMQPHEIIVASSGNSNYSSLSKPDNLLKEVLEQYCNFNNVKFKCIKHNKHALYKRAPKVKNFIKLIISTLAWEFQILILKLFYRKKKLIIGASDCYNTDRLLNDIAKIVPNSVPLFITTSKGFIKNNFLDVLTGKVYFFISMPNRFLFKKNKVKCNYKKFIDKCRSIINANENLFNIYGVSLGDSILCYLNNALFSEIEKIECFNHSISKLLLAGDVVSTFAPDSMGLNAVLGIQSKKNNIMSFVVSHGTVTKQTNEAKIEWDEHSKHLMGGLFTFIAVQTYAQKEFLINKKQNMSRTVETGPLIYSNTVNYKDIKLKNKLYGIDNKIIILHAGTPSSFKFFSPWVFETDDEYISSVNDIIKSLSRVQSAYLVVKVRKKHFPGMENKDIRELFVDSPNSEIFIDGLFEEYLSTADLLVSYSSTTIEEALAMKIPVLQYSCDNKYMHLQAPTATKGQELDINPIYYCGSKDELKDSFDIILKNIDLIKLEKYKWNLYRYPIDENFEWFKILQGK